ncbi:hypothetical protein A2573_02565 [Candidatus Woesebacteria bacterium RIFOXYD1_FULL_43_18]|uniref:General stress protein 17M-like domain-containing protein n=1 Tax=Candidatus Woesebacteria bacterium RIFOXYD1_FULL_43_18 TaxID=1802551 RepID=A0A1F8DKF1_9BACT|nr:MAG: hypothetical protein A2573_02565 [Candidatus Woesebacteria bacterium RIFOXYD1_FULL_43_18]
MAGLKKLGGDTNMHKLLFGIFKSPGHANEAIADLKESGIKDDKISVIVQDAVVSQQISGAKPTTGEKAAGGAAGGAVTGAALGALLGFLVGTTAITIPVLGPILVAGPFAGLLGLTGAASATVAGALTGGLAGGLVGALVKLGIPESEAKIYEERVKSGEILVIVSANSDEEHRNAENILDSHEAEEIRYYTIG